MKKFISKNQKKNFKEKKIKKSFFKKFEKLDPFYYVDKYVMVKVKEKTDSKYIEGLINFLFAGLFAIITYFLLGLLFGTNSPLVIVFSSSMEPTLWRGDIVALTKANSEMDFGKEIVLERNIKDIPVSKFTTSIYDNNKLEKIIFSNGEELSPTKNNSIVVYPSFPFNLPIIHRSIAKIKANDGVFILTKGDNDLTNPTFDQDCGEIDFVKQKVQKPCITFYAIPIEQIQGVSFLQIPKIGCIKLWLFDDLLSLITTGKLPENFKGIC